MIILSMSILHVLNLRSFRLCYWKGELFASSSQWPISSSLLVKHLPTYVLYLQGLQKYKMTR